MDHLPQWTTFFKSSGWSTWHGYTLECACLNTVTPNLALFIHIQSSKWHCLATCTIIWGWGWGCCMGSGIHCVCVGWGVGRGIPCTLCLTDLGLGLGLVSECYATPYSHLPSNTACVFGYIYVVIPLQLRVMYHSSDSYSQWLPYGVMNCLDTVLILNFTWHMVLCNDEAIDSQLFKPHFT